MHDPAMFFDTFLLIAIAATVLCILAFARIDSLRWRMNRDGVGVLIVEQNAVATLDVVERAYLIENGRVVMGGTAAELKSNPDIQAFYLGGVGTKDYTQVKHYRRRKRWLS